MASIRQGLAIDARKFVNNATPTPFYDVEGNKHLLFKNKDFTGYKQTDSNSVHVIWKRVKGLSVTVQIHHSTIRKLEKLGLIEPKG